MDKNITETPIHVVDFEGSLTSGVLEWGVVSIIGNSITKTQSRLCGNRSVLSEKEVQQHGISEALVKDLEPFEADWDLFAGLRQSGPLCAHHAIIENGFLRKTWAYPRASRDFLAKDPYKTVADWGPWLDTLQIYRRLYPGLESYQLDHLVKVFEIRDKLESLAKSHCPQGRGRFHCALFDALASALLIMRLFEQKELVDLSLYQLFIFSSNSSAQFKDRSQQELL